jgi:hypothetical protein
MTSLLKSVKGLPLSSREPDPAWRPAPGMASAPFVQWDALIVQAFIRP